MSYEPVDVYVEDSDNPGIPVPGVLVRVYSPDGVQLFTDGVTDEAGRVGFLLESQAYTFRFYRFATSFKQPQHFEVLADPNNPGQTLNSFQVQATTTQRPLATDPRFCRASGFFRDATGQPREGLNIHFIPDFSPAILDETLVHDELRILRTAKDGWGCIDLVRCACYSVTLAGLGDQVRHIRIPDSGSANLPDILFPGVSRIAFPTPELTVAVGAELEVLPQVFDSAGVPLPGVARDDVHWSVSDTLIATMSVGQTKLTFRGLAAGTTQLTARRRDTSIVRIPDAGIVGVPINIVVTE